MEWKKGDLVQVRDRRDNALAIPRAIVINAADAEGSVGVQDADDPAFCCRVPLICVETRGQKERNRR